MRNLRDKLKLKTTTTTTKKTKKYSPGARDVLCNPEDRKGLTMNFDRLKHPRFGKVVRGLKLWYKCKNGSKSDLNNYRPIYIVPAVAKSFEKILYDQLYHCLNENGLLNSCQSGFLSLHNTLRAL